MNITELQGEKTVNALAKRLLESSATQGASEKSKESEMEAALLRLNPHLNGIADLQKGTPVLLPENFPIARGESLSVVGSSAAGLLQEADAAIKNLSTAIAESVDQAGQQAERVQTWLKGDAARDVLRRAPELKEVFAGAATAAKTLRKEQSTLAEGEQKALAEVQAELIRFLENARR
jgi:hypothetical protein